MLVRQVRSKFSLRLLLGFLPKPLPATDLISYFPSFLFGSSLQPTKCETAGSTELTYLRVRGPF